MPPLRMTPLLAWRLSESETAKPPETARLTGEGAREVGREVERVMNGFVVSAGVDAAYLLPVDVFDEALVGDDTKTLFIPDMTEGVRGVRFTSERAR